MLSTKAAARGAEAKAVVAKQAKAAKAKAAKTESQITSREIADPRAKEKAKQSQVVILRHGPLRVAPINY